MATKWTVVPDNGTATNGYENDTLVYNFPSGEATYSITCNKDGCIAKSSVSVPKCNVMYQLYDMGYPKVSCFEITELTIKIVDYDDDSISYPYAVTRRQLAFKRNGIIDEALSKELNDNMEHVGDGVYSLRQDSVISFNLGDLNWPQDGEFDISLVGVNCYNDLNYSYTNTRANFNSLTVYGTNYDDDKTTYYCTVISDTPYSQMNGNYSLFNYNKGYLYSNPRGVIADSITPTCRGLRIVFKEGSSVDDTLSQILSYKGKSYPVGTREVDIYVYFCTDISGVLKPLYGFQGSDASVDDYPLTMYFTQSGRINSEMEISFGGDCENRSHYSSTQNPYPCE